MTKQEAKAAALRWLDEATSGGLALDVQTTADLEDRMDYLLDGAVAAVGGRFPHYEVYCRQPSEESGYVQVKLPEDLQALVEVRLCGADGRSLPFSDYQRVGRGEYVVPAAPGGSLYFTYIRLPLLPGPGADDGTELDVEPEAAALIPLRLAADVLVGVDETAALSAFLSARYSDMAAALYRRSEPDRAVVECVYDY